jgi:HlyD family secretion protein
MIKLSCSVITLVACTGLALSWYAMESETSAQVTASGRQDLESRVNGTVREAGTLNGANSLQLRCLIPGETTIVSLVPDGSQVSKGDVLAELDSSLIEEQIQQQQIVSLTAEAESERARSRWERTKLEEQIAAVESELSQMLSADSQQHSTPGVADIELEIKAQEKRLRTLGKKIELVRDTEKTLAGTPREVLEYQLMLLDFETEAEIAKGKLDHLKTNVLPHQQKLQTQQSKLTAQKLKLQKMQTAENTQQAEAEYEARKMTAEVARQRLKELQQQLENCRIVAPRDGIVVYANQSSRRTEPVVIEEGTTVRERQLLLTMPDLEDLQMNVSVHESKIARVKKGQSAKVRFDALPEQVFQGTVTAISDTALPGTWPNTDLREFEVIVSLEKPDPQLKLGLTGVVEIDVTQ